MAKAWKTCLKAAGISERFTPHGLRRTFSGMLRRAKVDPLIAKALTGRAIREHHSTVGLDEKWAGGGVGAAVPSRGGKCGRRCGRAPARERLSGGRTG